MVRAIGKTQKRSKSAVELTYTPARATKTLPLVQRVVKDLLHLSEAMEQQQIQLAGVQKLGDPIDRDAYRDELDDVEKSLTSQQEKWAQYVAELKAIGVIHHSPFDGSVDFPALLNRRPIRLCWKPGDPSVEFWHEIGETSADRKKIDREMLPALAG